MAEDDVTEDRLVQATGRPKELESEMLSERELVVAPLSMLNLQRHSAGKRQASEEASPQNSDRRSVDSASSSGASSFTVGSVDIKYNYNQEGLTALVSQPGLKTQKWRKAGVHCLFRFHGDVELIPDTILFVLNGNSQDGDLCKYHVNQLRDKFTTVVLQFTKDGKPDFYPLDELEVEKMYVGYKDRLSFQDVIASKGPKFQQRLFSLPGMQELAISGHLVGGEKSVIIETILSSQIGMKKNERVVIEANWNGPQVKPPFVDCYLVKNNEKGPYFIQMDGSHPIAYVPYICETCAQPDVCAESKLAAAATPDIRKQKAQATTSPPNTTKRNTHAAPVTRCLTPRVVEVQPATPRTAAAEVAIATRAREAIAEAAKVKAPIMQIYLKPFLAAKEATKSVIVAIPDTVAKEATKSVDVAFPDSGTMIKSMTSRTVAMEFSPLHNATAMNT